jgi:hypothetical protein
LDLIKNIPKSKIEIEIDEILDKKKLFKEEQRGGKTEV